MKGKRVILEMGSGNDLHGGDYTKAAVRAVEDAIHHSSLTFIRTLGVDPRAMRVEVTIGVQQPQKVDAEVVKRTLPHGQRCRSVLDELDELVAEDHRAGRRRQILPHLESGGVDLRRQPAILEQILDIILQPLPQTVAAGIEELSHGGGVSDEGVCRRERVNQDGRQ